MPWKITYPSLSAQLATTAANTTTISNPSPSGGAPTGGPAPSVGKGGTFSKAQLEQLWIGAGGPASQANTAAAIALAESSGNPNAENRTDNGGTQTSWGLWQISNGTHSMPVANILSATVNAQQAVAKYRGAGNSFSPWGTYDSGAYKQFL